MSTRRARRARTMLTTYTSGASYGFAPSASFQPYGFSEALVPLFGAGTALTTSAVTAISAGIQAKKGREHELAMQQGSAKLTVKQAKLAQEQAKVEAARAAAEEAKASASRAMFGWTAGSIILLGVTGIGAWVYIKKGEEK